MQEGADRRLLMQDTHAAAAPHCVQRSHGAPDLYEPTWLTAAGEPIQLPVNPPNGLRQQGDDFIH